LVGVKKDMNSIAKNKGAKFDIDQKQWYFIYDLDKFINDKTLCTFEFKPYGCDIITSQKYINLKEFYNEAYNRHLNYIEGLEGAV